MIDVTYQKHKNVVLWASLGVGGYTEGELWCAVEYFMEGFGRFQDRSFCPEEDWERLLERTGRG